MRLRLTLLALVCALSPSFSEAQWRSSLLPVLGSAPETGGQFGVALFRTRQPDDSLGTRPSSLIGNAIVTSKAQRRAFIEYDRWTAGNERRLQITAIASKFPLPFYGYGDDSPDEPFDYEPTTFEFSVTGARKSGRASWRYAGLRLVDTRARETAFVPPSPFVACDTLPPGLACASTPVAHTVVEGNLVAGNYRLALATAGWMRDSRDNIFAPTRGSLLDVSFTGGVTWHPRRSGPPTALTRLRVDWRAYRPLANGSVIAGQIALSDAQGQYPLDQVALVGHHSLNRGYTMGRFRDLSMLASQLEWRSPARAFGNRLGFAAFGAVAYISGYEPSSRPLPSAGAGLRYRLDPRTRSTIRVDYAVGASGQSGLYVAFNEAF